VTVKTGGETSRADRREEERRREMVRGSASAILMLFLLGRVALMAGFGRAVPSLSDWILGVVYLKSARRFWRLGLSRTQPWSARLIGYLAWYTSNLQGVFGATVRHRHDDGASHACMERRILASVMKIWR